MLLKKITHGFVIQVFDVEQRRWTSQEFVAGDETEYETEDGAILNCEEFAERTADKREPYLPFEMVQPAGVESHLPEPRRTNARPAASSKEQSPMTKRELRGLLRTDRDAALALLIDCKVDEWFNDGLPEIKRVLTLWAANQADAPRLDLGPDELILEMADNCRLFSGEDTKPLRRL